MSIVSRKPTRLMMSGLLLASALSMLALGGCTKKKECDALAKVMKEEREPFGKGEDGKDDFKKMSKTYRKAGEAVAAVPLTVPELKTKRDEYVDFLEGMAKAAEMTAKMQAGEVTREEAKKALDGIKGKSELDLYIDTLRVCTD